MKLGKRTANQRRTRVLTELLGVAGFEGAP